MGAANEHEITAARTEQSSAWYRTADDRFDVLGGDLNTNNAAGRAAGAGVVWAWQPAHPTGVWGKDIHPFTTKAACLADLERHIAASAPQAAATSSGRASGRVPGASRAALDDLMETLAAANAPFVGVPVPPATPRTPDPVDLMMAGDYVGAIAAYRAIVAESGDPLGVCAEQIATCKEALRKIALCDDVKAIVACASCAQQNRVIVGVPSRCGKCKAPMSVGVAL